MDLFFFSYLTSFLPNNANAPLMMKITPKAIKNQSNITHLLIISITPTATVTTATKIFATFFALTASNNAITPLTAINTPNTISTISTNNHPPKINTIPIAILTTPDVRFLFKTSITPNTINRIPTIVNNQFNTLPLKIMNKIPTKMYRIALTKFFLLKIQIIACVF